MSEKKQVITVGIGDDGRVSVDFSGFVGQACIAEAEEIEAELAKLGVVVDLKGREGKAALSQGPTPIAPKTRERKKVKT